MGFFSLTSIFIIIGTVTLSSSIEAFPLAVKNKLIYTNSTSGIQHALHDYLEAFQQYNEHDYYVLRNIAEKCLISGIISSNPHTQKSSILGAGIASCEESMIILSKAMETNDPIIQLLILGIPSMNSSNSYEELLIKAMSSPYPLIKLEAAYRLSCLKNSEVIDRLHSFIDILPEEVQCLSAAIFLRLENPESDTYIRKLLSSSSTKIRSHTAFLIGEYQQRRFAPTLKHLLTSSSSLDQESALFALGQIKDAYAYSEILPFLNKQDHDIALAAAIALIKIGKEEPALNYLKTLVSEENPKALYSCRHLSKHLCESLLLPIFHKTINPESRLNATLALLEHGCHPPELMQYLESILLNKHHKVLTPSFSKAKTLCSWKLSNIVYPKESPQYSRMLQQSQAMEEKILNDVACLSGGAYLPFIEKLLSHNKIHLIDKAISILSCKRDLETLSMLKRISMEAKDSSIIKAFTDLALYKITGEATYKESLYYYSLNLIQQPILFIDNEKNLHNKKEDFLKHSVTPEVQAKLMLEILETLVTSKTKEDILSIVKIMTQTHEKNLPILAGLLMKIVE